MEESKLENVLGFYYETIKLKEVERSGWNTWNVSRDKRVESIPEHVYGTQQLAFATVSYTHLNPMLGQSYVPYQYMDKTFKPCVGLKMGTIFPELVSPYVPGQSMEQIRMIENMNTIGKECNKCQ